MTQTVHEKLLLRGGLAIPGIASATGLATQADGTIVAGSSGGGGSANALIGGANGPVTWATGAAYSVNQFVFYGGLAFICTTAHTSGSTFDLTKFQMVGGATGVDIPPTSGNLGYDYEFLNPGSSLPSGWSWTNQGAAVYAEYQKGGVLTNATTNSGGSVNYIAQPAPAAPFTLTAKLRFAASAINFPFGGLIFADASGKILTFGSTGQSGAEAAVNLWNSPTSFNAGVTSNAANAAAPTYPITLYFRVTYTSATNITLSWSASGAAWISAASSYNPGTGLGTVAKVGLGVNSQNFQAMLDCEWFRVR